MGGVYRKKMELDRLLVPAIACLLATAPVYGQSADELEAEPQEEIAVSFWPEYYGAALKALYKNDYVKAESLLKIALERAADFGPQNSKMGLTLNALGELYLRTKRVSLAEKTFRQALEIQNTLGPDSEVTAQTMVNLASALDCLQKYAESEPIYRKALEIRLATHNKRHPHIASNMEALAKACFRTQKFADAESYFRQALATNKMLLPPGHPNTVSVLNNLAWFYFSRKEYTQADYMCQRLLEETSKGTGNHNSTYAQVLFKLAQVYDKQARFAEAAQLYETMVKIARTSSGVDTVAIANCCNSLAQRCESVNKDDLGLKFRHLTVMCSDHDKRINSQQRQTYLSEYARSLIKAGRIAEAERVQHIAAQLAVSHL